MAASRAFGADFSQLPIEQVDIDSVREPNGLLTDTAVRQIILHYGNHSASSRIRFVDPTWLAEYELVEGDAIDTSHIPTFLTERTPGGNHPVGLAMPYNIGNGHWTTLYVNLEARGAVYFDSLTSSAHSLHRAETIMRRFFAQYELFFQGQLGAPFHFHVDTQCAHQNDGSSCGIYTCRNILDLLDHRRPNFTALTEMQRMAFRRNGTALLEAKMAGRQVPVPRRTEEGRWGGPKSPIRYGQWSYNMYEGNKEFGKGGESCGVEAKGEWKPFSNFFRSGQYGFV
ncbi:hypothetical protein BDZ45DRAFT_695950 [Acephala macrosclerotiorum]|nr:hypothetical protein BDZ45DRAFT_695950 [Acephala macrosclerotiorum]